MQVKVRILEEDVSALRDHEKHPAQDDHDEIRYAMQSLFIAAMMDAIERRPRFSLHKLVKAKKLFDQRSLNRFGLTIEGSYVANGAFHLNGQIVSAGKRPWPFPDVVITYVVQFALLHDYKTERYWDVAELKTCVEQVVSTTSIKVEEIVGEEKEPLGRLQEVAHWLGKRVIMAIVGV